MARTAEVLIPPNLSRNGGPMLQAMAAAISKSGTHKVDITSEYKGKADLLMLYGVGGPVQSVARKDALEKGHKVVMWDIGYFGRRKLEGYLRCSIDKDHPPHLLDNTPANPERWNDIHVQLRSDFRLDGHILLIGLGPKSKIQLGDTVRNWEQHKLLELEVRFPKHRIIFRPKPRRPYAEMQCKTDSASPIEDLLKKAYLVVCRHSNVAIDATIAGIPFECEDGAAKWLADREFTEENRLIFLQKLAWWQWRFHEADKAWNFLQERLN